MRPGCLVWCLSLLGAVCLAPAGAAEAVQFVFAPPAAGIALLVTERSTATTLENSTGTDVQTVTVTVTRTKRFFKKTATGYTVTEIRVARTETANGKARPLDGEEKARLNHPISYDLDAAGTLLAVRGVEALHANARAAVAREDLPLFDKVLTLEHMQRMVRGEWEARVTPYLGLAKAPGDRWTATAPELLFSPALVPLPTTYTFEKLEPVLDRPCAVVKTVLTPDLAVAAADLRVILEGMDLVPAGVTPTYTVEAFSVERTAHLDPALLFPLKSSTTTTRNFTVTVGGDAFKRAETEVSTTTAERLTK